MKEEGDENKGEGEGHTPGTRNQPDMRGSENKIYRREER